MKMTYRELLGLLNDMDDEDLDYPVLVEDDTGYAFQISELSYVDDCFDVDVEAEIGQPVLREY